MLRVHLFGRPRLLLDEIAFPLSGRPKVMPLLAYFLLHRQTAVSRRHVANVLWPDDFEEEARANFRRHLNYVHQLLPQPSEGRPWLLSAAGHVQWNPRCDLWLDVAEFERFAATPQGLADAVALYAGDLLSDSEEEWLEAERERLKTLYRAALTALIRSLRAARDYVPAIGAAQRLLAHDPWREDTLRTLILLRYEFGDRAGALAEYERFARALRSDLGVEPMGETRAVYESIARDAPLPAPAHATPAPRPARGGTPYMLPFVGRSGEMTALHERWSLTLTGSGGLALVAGEAGIGKSRLVREFSATCEAQGAQVYCGATTFPETVPYQAFVDVLRSTVPLVTTVDLDSVWSEAIATLVPAIGGYATAERQPLPPVDPARERLRLFEACSNLWIALAKRRPLVLVLEDVHSAGAATLALMEHVARRCVQSSVLIVATYREDELELRHPLHGVRRRLEGDGVAFHVALARLSGAAVETFVRELAESDDAVELARMLHQRSEGNPFFLHEILRDLDESGRLRICDRRWSFDRTWEAALPPAVRSALSSRVARLGEAPRALVETAAIIGRGFHVELLRETTGWPEAAVLDALGDLTDRRIVIERGTHGGSDFSFSHNLIQSVVYETIEPAARLRRHRRVAHVMSNLYADQGDELAAELAFHFERGGEPELAAQRYFDAAGRALAVYGNEEAQQYLSSAIELGRAPRLRLDALLLRERVEAARGDRAAQARDIEVLIPLARSSGDDDKMCMVLERRIQLANSTGDRRRERVLLELLQRRVRRSGDLRWHARALEAEAKYRRGTSEFDAARAAFAKLTSIAERSGDRGAYAQARLAIADTYIYEGRLAQAHALLADLRDAVRAAGNQAALVFTLMAYARAALAQQDYTAMSEFATEAYELSRTIGDSEGEALALHTLANGLVYTFRVRETQSYYDRAAALYERINHRVGLASIAVDIGLFYTELGLLDRALEYYDRADLLAAEIGFHFVSCVERIDRSYCLRLRGDVAAAKTSAGSALALSREIRSQHLESAALGTLGAAESALGAHVAAIEHLRSAVELRRPAGMTPRLGDNLCALALAHLRAGDAAAAGGAAGELLALHDANPQLAPQPTEWLWVAAQVEAACGHEVAAGLRLRQARARMQARAAAIDDATTRAAFLALPFNRAVVEALSVDA